MKDVRDYLDEWRNFLSAHPAVRHALLSFDTVSCDTELQFQVSKECAALAIHMAQLLQDSPELLDGLEHLVQAMHSFNVQARIQGGQQNCLSPVK